MRQTEAFVHTLRDAPADSEAPSHRLLAQAGFITKYAAGMYAYSPAMTRVLRKISQIVREEMDSAGAQEVLLPIVQPKELWESSGRWDRYIAEGLMFHFDDRKSTHLCLGPTHEEVMTTLASTYINSYKQLPVNLYQIQTKFRDELRPRFGLLRCREFIMKDAYSFDVDQEGLDTSYDKMSKAYSRFCERLGLEYRKVQADSGAIGGSGSQEFMVLAETGEDLILYCDKCEYAANQERAESLLEEFEQDSEMKEMEDVKGEGIIGVEALAEFLNIEVWRTTKTILFMADGEPVAVMVRGDCDVNEIKVANKLDCTEFRMATPEEIKELTGADVGYAGPIGLPDNIRILADNYAGNRVNLECGANRTDYHTLNANFGRDFPEPEFGDFKLAQPGETCSCCKEGKLQSARGIEVGHIFKLGTKYSEAMKAEFLDQNGKSKPFVMGCYGIGVSRTAAAAVEQRHDEKGICWPMSICPWQVHLVCLNPKKEDQKTIAEKLYSEMLEAGIEVLFDDRPVSPGIKFNDSDLIGLPLRVTVGRDAKDGKVELRERINPDGSELVSIEEITAAVNGKIEEDGLIE